MTTAMSTAMTRDSMTTAMYGTGFHCSDLLSHCPTHFCPAGAQSPDRHSRQRVGRPHLRRVAQLNKLELQGMSGAEAPRWRELRPHVSVLKLTALFIHLRLGTSHAMEVGSSVRLDTGPWYMRHHVVCARQWLCRLRRCRAVFTSWRMYSCCDVRRVRCGVPRVGLNTRKKTMCDVDRE